MTATRRSWPGRLAMSSEAGLLGTEIVSVVRLCTVKHEFWTLFPLCTTSVLNKVRSVWTRKCKQLSC